MSNVFILRFRDLITEEGGTISDHQSLINKFGEVWWGWWMKQDEEPPIELFKSIADQIESVGTSDAFLFDSGLDRIYSVKIKKILVAPQKNKIGTPDPEVSPSYYHRGRYPAWFLLSSIKEVDFDTLKLRYASFPTRPHYEQEFKNSINQRVHSLNELKEFNVTLWHVVLG